MSFYSLFSFIQHLLFAVRQRLEVVFTITRWLWWCHWWAKAPCVSSLWGCTQWRNLTELLCFISPHSSPEDRITMPSLSGTKAGAMWVVSSCLPDLSLWWVSISSLLLPLRFWGEGKESNIIILLSPCSLPALYQMEVPWFLFKIFLLLFLSVIIFSFMCVNIYEQKWPCLHLHIFIPLYCYFYYNHGDGSLKSFWQIRERFHRVLESKRVFPAIYLHCSFRVF